MTSILIFSPADGELEVVEINDKDPIVKRLCELGICIGKRIRIIKSGNPTILGIGNARFAMSNEYLLHIYVKPVAY